MAKAMSPRAWREWVNRLKAEIADLNAKLEARPYTMDANGVLHVDMDKLKASDSFQHSLHMARLIMETQKMTCPNCGGRMHGDGVTEPYHYERIERPDDVEPDANPVYCEVAQPTQFPIGWNEMPPEDVLRAEAKVSGWMREHRITDWALGHSASREMLCQHKARIADLERENAALGVRLSVIEKWALTTEDDSFPGEWEHGYEAARNWVAMHFKSAVSPGKEPTDAE